METNIKQGLGKWSANMMVLTGSIMISFSSVFVKLANVGPITSGFYRVLFGAVILVPIAICFRRTFLTGWRYFFLALVCGLIFALDLTVWHKSIHGIGPGLATVLANFQVFILTAIGVIFFKEKLTKWSYISILLAILGLFLLVGPGWNTFTDGWKWGVVFGLLTALVYATYILLIRHLQSDKDNAAQIWNIALVSLLTAAFMAVEIPMVGESFSIPDTKSFWSLVAYGFFSQSIGWYLISRGLPLIDISISGLIILLQPSLAFIWDVLFFARPTTKLDVIGSSIVLVAIYIGVTSRKT